MKNASLRTCCRLLINPVIAFAMIVSTMLPLSSAYAVDGAPEYTGVTPPSNPQSPEGVVPPSTPPRICPAHLRLLGNDCVCPNPNTVDNGTCCQPQSCPVGQAASCGANGVGACGCPAGSILASSAGSGYSIFGAAPTTCVPSTCPSTTGTIVCTGNPSQGQSCTCRSCPPNAPINPVTGLCTNQCLLPNVTLTRITVTQELDRTRTGQPILSGPVPSCLLQRAAALCPGFTGLINSEEYNGRAECRYSEHFPIPGGLTSTIAQMNAAQNHLNNLHGNLVNQSNYLNAVVGHLNALSAWVTALSNAYNANPSWPGYYAWLGAYGAYNSYLPNYYAAAAEYNNRLAAYNSYLNGGYASISALMNECNRQNTTAAFLSDDCFARMVQRMGSGLPVWQFAKYADRPEWMYSIEGIYANQQVTFDDNCNVVDPNNACHVRDVSLRYTWTPLSLEWDGEQVLNNLAFTQFPVDPAEKNKWFSWRGSEKSPLLVFDPKHTKNITSAEQLFGSFSFGKKWKNGFEALASLDKNGDRRLAGDELSDLALWFDRGADGIPAAEEIRSLADAKVTALYFRDAEKLGSGDLRLSVGFERTINGTKEYGAIVDWLATTFSTLEEAIGYTQQNAKASSKGVSFKLFEASKEAREAMIDESKLPTGKLKTIAAIVPPTLPVLPSAVVANQKTDRATATGVWVWKVTNMSGVTIKDKSAEPPSGVLAFNDIGGELKGQSLIEVPVGADGNLRQLMTMPITGRIGAGEGRTAVLDFEVKTKDGSTTKSVAKMNEAGTELRGESTMDLGTTSGGKSNTIKYTWVAVRKILPMEEAKKIAAASSNSKL